MKRFIIFMLTALIMLTGCSGKNSSRKDNAAKSSYDLIFVCPIKGIEYWKMCIEGIADADRELGTSTLVMGPETADGFDEKIVDFMSEAVDKKPDGILCYAGITEMQPLIDKAVKAGIPVIAIDSDAPDSMRSAYIGSDDYALGSKAAQKIVELTGGKGKVGVMVSSKAAQREMSVVEMFRDCISDYDIVLTDVEETGADQSAAKELTMQMIADGVDAVFATGMTNVTGAGEAKKELGRTDIPLIGFDDSDDNLRLVREGCINGIIVQQPRQMGYKGVYIMKELLENGHLTKTNYDTGSTYVDISNIDTYKNEENASEDSGKRIKVGYYNGDDLFQNGMSDGERKSGFAYEYYQSLALYTGWQYEYIYGTREQIVDKLVNGEIDIMAGVYKTAQREKQVLFSSKDMGFGDEERFFAVAKGRSDLKAELDHAMELITKNSPNYNMLLFEKYYSSGSEQMLTDAEKEWLGSKREIVIGYVDNNLPYCGTNQNGSADGVIKELSVKLNKILNITISHKKYKTVEELEKAVVNGDADAAFPIYSDIWLSEQKGIRQTTSFINDRLMIVYNGAYSDDLLDRIALCKGRLSQREYPGSKITYYDTPEDMFAAVKSGRSRCGIGCASIIQRLLAAHPEYRDFSVAYLDESESFGMAVRQDNAMLAVILNKSIRQIDNAALTNAMLHYSSVDPEYSFSYYVQKHFLGIIMTVLVLFALIVIFFLLYFHKTMLYNRHQAEAQAKLEKALEAANAASKAKTDFLSSMSHDIRTPMNAISGMALIASKNIDDKDRIKDCLDKISISSRHLLTLINDVLDISKIESNNLALKPTNFSITEMMAALVHIVRPQAEDKKLEFTVNIHDIEYDIIFADEVRLDQIYMNLLTNAVKYTHSGSVTVDLSQELQPDGKTLCLTYTVEDTGMGMTPEFMENMYTTFSRGQDSRINKIQGTGLGLAIVKQLVDTMGGIIGCESEVDKGTKFSVILNVPIGKDDKDRPKLPDMHVLVADDDAIFLETVVDTLAEIGVRADIFTSGKAAVDAVKKSGGIDYAAFIVDWNMPEVNGKETVQALREVSGDSIPVIVISSYDLSDIEEELKSCGVSDFVSKPVFRADIYRKLKEVLEISDGEHGHVNHLTGKHLLVAEDNDLNWEVISELLDMNGITAERAENGQLCVEMLNSSAPGRFDAVLMDIQMPVMNGRDATRLIRKSSKEWVKDLTVIAMTADAFAEDIAACTEAGMDGHFSKPIDVDVLMQVLKRFIGT